MRTYCVIGERSKIGKYIIKYMPREFTRIPESDLIDKQPEILFISVSTDRAKSLIEFHKNKSKIIDLSGSQKLRSYVGKNKKSEFEFVYGFGEINKPKTKKNIANPGCSSLGTLTALYPIRRLLKKDIFVDVKFSKSAMRHSSENIKLIQDNSILVHPFSHFQQIEINYVLKNKLNVLVATNIVGIEHGISLNIFAKVKDNKNIYKRLKSFYEKNEDVVVSETPVELRSAVGTKKIYLYVKQINDSVLINAVFDNLIYGGAYNAVKFAVSSSIKK